MGQLFEPSEALRSQMSSGYRSTDYAVSEIIDNSIEANATLVDVLIVESTLKQRVRRSTKISQICIVDNGTGIAPDILSRVLCFGFGTHHGKTDFIDLGEHGKMGKFGYGLPNSSVSVANDIHVWSWRDGLESTHHTALNVKDVLDRKVDGVEPLSRQRVDDNIVKMCEAIGHEFGNSGTVVNWNDTERSSWAKSGKLFEHLEEVVGRIYRKFINDGSVRIRVSIFHSDDYTKPISNATPIRVNDPLYLMKGSITSDLLRATFSREDASDQEKKLLGREDEFFQGFPSGRHEKVFNVVREDGTYQVKFTQSLISHDFRKVVHGSSDVGQLAARNQGVSICRAGRELELDARTAKDDTRHRWWGMEIDFPPALDDVFGVTNNKQSATHFSAVLSRSWKELVDDYNQQRKVQYEDSGQPVVNLSFSGVIEEMKAEGDLNWILYVLCKTIDDERRKMLPIIRKMVESKVTLAGPDESGDADEVNDAVVGDSEESEVRSLSPEEYEEVSEKFKVPAEDISRFKEWLDSNLPVMFTHYEEDTPAVFSYQKDYGRVKINLNEANVATEELYKLLRVVNGAGVEEEKQEVSDPKELVRRLRICVSLMFVAMANAEAESVAIDEVRDNRQQWGRLFSKYVKTWLSR